MSAETDLRARLIAERENARTADEIVAAVSPAPTPGVANGARYVVALPFPRGANGGTRGTRSTSSSRSGSVDKCSRPSRSVAIAGVRRAVTRYPQVPPAQARPPTTIKPARARPSRASVLRARVSSSANVRAAPGRRPGGGGVGGAPTRRPDSGAWRRPRGPPREAVSVVQSGARPPAPPLTYAAAPCSRAWWTWWAALARPLAAGAGAVPGGAELVGHLRPGEAGGAVLDGDSGAVGASRSARDVQRGRGLVDAVHGGRLARPMRCHGRSSSTSLARRRLVRKGDPPWGRECGGGCCSCSRRQPPAYSGTRFAWSRRSVVF